MSAEPVGYAGTTTASGTSHVVALPADIVQPELILVLARFATATTITGPAGWTVIGSGGSNGMHVLARVAAGDEGTTVTFTTAIATAAEWQVRRIQNAWPQPSGVEVAFATGTSTTPDPPSLTPSWGADNLDNLWIVAGRSATSQTWTPPAPYGGGQTQGGTLSSAWLQLLVELQDPAVFTIGSSEAWVAATIAVRAFEEGAYHDPEMAGGAGAGIRGPIYDVSGPPEVEIDEV